ncbi:MAG: exodeoxyribonuclease VII large subunit [Pseudomonadota bacterium]|nr:exodeoxyribonuclease VII large subunit [Pseudomonadota bacterium]
MDFDLKPAAAVRPDRDIYTVSRLNREVRVLLDRGFGTLWIEAEISNLAKPSSGHWYFSLKDAAAQVRCAMFRQRNMLCAFSARDGQKVLVRARIGLYEPRGEYQLIIDHMEDAGWGALKRQFEELSAKLAAEGLFAADRKRPLPKLPVRIGIVTSPTGAAVRDILHVLARRFPAIAVLIYPVPVQGAQAAADIIAALALAGRRAECGVLILARGGGSLEDLWAFNDERLARAIAASPIPIITGIGHEVDFTIADFAADVRAPTPSAAAELAVPDAEEWLDAFGRLGARLQRCMRRRIARQSEQLRWLVKRATTASPAVKLTEQAQRLDELEQCLARAVLRQLRSHRERLRWLTGRAALVSPSARLAQQLMRLENLRQRLGRVSRQNFDARHAALSGKRSRLWQASPIVHVRHAAARQAALFARLQAAQLSHLRRSRERLLPLVRTLHAVSPLATLERGYAIVTTEGGAIVRDAADAPPDTLIEARLGTGSLRARVER